MVNSNRYPRQGAARDYRRLPREERRYPRPDNDNDPNRPRPRPRKPRPLIPANDNRPVPKVGDWSQPRPPRLPGWARWLGRFMRLYPVIGALLTLYELYELYEYYQGRSDPGVPDHCSDPSDFYPLRAATWLHTPAVCTEFIGPTGGDNWGPGNPWYNTWQGRVLPWPFSGERWLRMDAYLYDSDPGENPLDPKTLPWPRPWIDPDFPGIYDNPFPDPLQPTEPFPRPRKPLRPDPRNRPDDRTHPDPRLPPRPRLPEDRVSRSPRSIQSRIGEPNRILVGLRRESGSGSSVSGICQMSVCVGRLAGC